MKCIFLTYSYPDDYKIYDLFGGVQKADDLPGILWLTLYSFGLFYIRAGYQRRAHTTWDFVPLPYPALFTWKVEFPNPAFVVSAKQGEVLRRAE